MPEIRLDKYLADAGQGSRSQVKSLIKQGRVKIGDETATKAEQKIDIACENVYVDGNRICYRAFEYYMLNKPQGFVSARKDKWSKTVLDLIDEDKRRDLFPVGRLDKDTEGLLIITNDGKLSNDILSPKKHVPKIYYAIIYGNVTEETIRQFEEGLDIGDGKLTKPAKVKILSDSKDHDMVSPVEITITEGRYHQIKKMFEAVGMEVMYLRRIAMGRLFLDDKLLCGMYRRMTDEEVALLRAYAE
ncbi:MAG: rRNA pseudouridine synthase [Clostridium sp.]|nr:rRNA pseudouridine synthase [Clostridium sp.]MCM1399672.1 rRNA pseudouridine synthase [Clostridium sp.]MCM1460532.1 rRNA pseudouridine synthase [Bacteroides sp.]